MEGEAMKEFVLSLAVLLSVVVGVLLVDGERHQGQEKRNYCIREDGRRAARCGVPPTACPWMEDSARYYWMVGWQQGYRLGLVEDE